MSVSGRMTAVIDALNDAGIPTERGFPAEKMQAPQAPVAAVTVERSSTEEVVLAVWIYCPPALGGRVCEDTAQTVAEVLRQRRGFCQVGACEFDSRSNLFTVKIQALFKETLINQVKLNSNVLVYVTEFSAVQTRQVQQQIDETSGGLHVVNEEVVWTIAVQEQLPFREAIAVEDKEAFTLTVTHDSYVEVYPECYWLSITLEENGGGLLRKRIARSWTERVVEYEEERTE